MLLIPKKLELLTCVGEHFIHRMCARRASSHSLKRCRRQGGRLRAPWWIMQKCPWVFKRLALDLLQGMITVWDFSNSIIHCIIMVLFLHLFFFCLESLTTMSHQTHSHILLFKLYSSTWDLWTPCFKHPQRRLTVHIPPQNLLCDHLQG